MTKTIFRVVVESPHGTQPIESFKSHLSDLKSEALTRFGIEIRYWQEPPKKRFQIVAEDGSILGEVEAKSIGASTTFDMVQDALENEIDEPLSVRVVGDTDETATKDDFQ